MKKLTIFVVLFVWACALSQAQESHSSLAHKRASHLQHGINASIWFAQSPRNYSVERLRSFTTVEDIELMQKMGFDHVRLSIDAEPLAVAFQQGEQSAPFLHELDRVVKAMLEHHLAVIVDVHPESDYKARLRTGDDGVQRFALLWQQLARHFSQSDPELVFFEIMNECEQEDPYRWQGIQSFVANQIRAIAPKHTLIASGARWDGLGDLLQLQPLPLDNVIYTFHNYEPFPFTHQGATWTSLEVQPLKNLPYPSSPEAVESNLLQEPTLSGKFFVEQYGLARWDANRIDATLRFAELWGQQFHVPVYCGEFGVHIPVADPKMRAAWIRDTRLALEKRHIGWAMWDYQTNFGVVSKANNKTTVNSLVVDALGLHRIQ